MHEVWLLSKVLLKNDYNLAKGKKRARNILIGLLLLICCAPMIYMLYGNLYFLFSIQAIRAGLELGFFLICVVSIFLLLVSFPASFYFSRDTQFLLPLPLKPGVITTAKLMVLFVGQFILGVILYIPMLIAWGQSGFMTFAGLLNFLVQSIIIPLDFLLILGSVTLLVMRFMPFFKNKDRFNMVVTIIGLMFAGSLGFVSSMASVQDTEQVLMSLIEDGSLLHGWMKYGFYPIVLGVDSIVNGSWMSFAGSIFVFASLLGIFYSLADVLYFPVVTTMASAPQKRRQIRTMDIPIGTYAKDAFFLEMKKLLRSPAYASNCIISSIFMPVLWSGILIFADFREHFTQYTRALNLTSFPLISIAFLAGAAAGLMLGSINGISASAISREGKQGVHFMKQIPIALTRQVLIKGSVGFVFSLITTLLMLAPLTYLFKYPVWIILFYIPGAILSCALLNAIGLLVDLMHPKLIWDNETAAVKNNLNVVLEILISWLLLAILALPFLFARLDLFWVYALVVGLVLAGLDALLVQIIIKKTDAFFVFMQ